MNNIAKELRQHMHRQHLNTRELARRSGVKASFIYDVLSGKSANPSTLKLAKVAHVLGLNLSQLVEPEPAFLPSLKITQTLAYDRTISPQWLQPNHDENPPEPCEMLPPISFSKRWLIDQFQLNATNLELFQIQGDMMSPTLQQGDLVLVNRTQNHPSPAGLYMLHDGHCANPKRLEYIVESGEELVRISCDNDYYACHHRKLNDITIMGRIVWVSRTLH